MYKLRTKHGKKKYVLDATFSSQKEAESYAAYLVSIDPEDNWRDVYEVFEQPDETPERK